MTEREVHCKKLAFKCAVFVLCWTKRLGEEGKEGPNTGDLSLKNSANSDVRDVNKQVVRGSAKGGLEVKYVRR